MDDQFRQFRSKRALQSENDRLLAKANAKIDASRRLPGDGKDQARAIVSTGMLLGLGLLPFFATLSLWFYTYHESFVETICVTAALLILSALLCVGSFKRSLGKDRPAMWWLGVICAQATLVGTFLGFFCYFHYLAYYWKYQEMRTYTNVAAAQTASAFGDGSMFLFTEDTRVDASRGVGFKSKWSGETYCAAPIVDSSMGQGSDINYWAVGEGCCAARGDFKCDDAGDFSTRSALVVLEPADVVRPFMQWAVRHASYPKFTDAIALAEAQYLVRASATPKLVRWSRDPIAMKDAFHRDAVSLCKTCGTVYVSLAAVLCYAVSWQLVPKQRNEGLMREAP